MDSSPIKVVGAVFADGPRILAAKRRPGKSMAGFWEFPGGKIEPGETPQEALARELHEELGIEAAIGEHVTTTVHAYEFATIELATYLCTITKGTPTLTDHDEVRWVPRNQLHELKWAPADIPAVDILINTRSAKA